MSKERLFPDKTGLELSTMLENSCDGVSNEQYEVNLTPQEEESIKDRIVDLSVQLMDVEERKAKIMKEFKKELKPINEELGEELSTVKRGTHVRTGKLFKYVEGHTANFYDINGVFIYSRPIREDERQYVIKEGHKSASNE